MAAVLNTRKSTPIAAILDRLGICVSTVCLVQCLVLPVLVVVTPLASLGFLGEEAFHFALLAVILPIALIAFALGYRTHRSGPVLAFGVAGLAAVAFAALAHDLLGPLGTALVTSAGGVALIGAHLRNLRLRRNICLQPDRL